MAIFPLAAYLFSTNHSLELYKSQLGLVGREQTHEAAMKSSKQFTYRCEVVNCHFQMPNYTLCVRVSLRGAILRRTLHHHEYLAQRARSHMRA